MAQLARKQRAEVSTGGFSDAGVFIAGNTHLSHTGGYPSLLLNNAAALRSEGLLLYELVGKQSARATTSLCVMDFIISSL